VAVGEPGELIVRGPQVMQGYWQRPEATAEVLGRLALHRRRGGDGRRRHLQHRRPQEGHDPGQRLQRLSQRDRGRHRAPRQGAQESAVIGVPDAKTGEAVQAYVVKRDEALAHRAEVLAHCKRELLTGYKHCRAKVEFRDELPKTPVGKILRRDLRATGQAAEARQF
jgi:long-chain acyl-CoA synthetase